MSRLVPLLAALVAVPLALATRWPSGGIAGIVAGAAGAAAVAAAVLAAVRPGRWHAPAGFAAACALLAVPRPQDAWLDVHPAVVAVLVLVMAHLLYASRDAQAPWHGPAPAAVRGLVRWAPVVAVLAVVSAAPLLAALWLPDRLARSRELLGPAGIVTSGLLVLALLVCLALLRNLVRSSDVEVAA